MLIGGDDISNDIITLATWFSMLVYISARFRFALIDGNLTDHSTGSHRGIGGRIQIPELQPLLSFPPARAPRARLHKTSVTTTGIRTCTRNLSALH